MSRISTAFGMASRAITSSSIVTPRKLSKTSTPAFASVDRRPRRMHGSTTFSSFAATSDLPADFITTHHYPNDVIGMEPADDTVSQLAASRRSALRDQTRKVRDQAGNMPVYYTEWCTSSNPRNPLHDEPYAAAFVVKTIMEANGLVQGYSYWTFSDIFEENYFPSVPFHGGLGCSISTASRSRCIGRLNCCTTLGRNSCRSHGSHATVDAWVIRHGHRATILLINFALPRHPIAAEIVRVSLHEVRAPVRATIQRIDQHHANAKGRWHELGEPEYPDAKALAQLHAASALHHEMQAVRHSGATLELDVAMPPLAVAAVTLEFTEPVIEQRA